MKETCWVLTGPTASGKTALSLRLARTHDCEIVCMDSMQIYRGYGIRNTVSLLPMRQTIDNALAIYVGGVKIPVLTLIIIALACLFIVCSAARSWDRTCARWDRT